MWTGSLTGVAGEVHSSRLCPGQDGESRDMMKMDSHLNTLIVPGVLGDAGAEEGSLRFFACGFTS